MRRNNGKLPKANGGGPCHLSCLMLEAHEDRMPTGDGRKPQLSPLFNPRGVQKPWRKESELGLHKEN
jgi:hypothetical protein